jgi:hypothetical protein
MDIVISESTLANGNQDRKMPTNEQWINQNVLSTTWIAPLTSTEVKECFAELANLVQNTQHEVHILFDIKKAGFIPVQAPMHFIRCHISTLSNLGSIAVIGTDPIAQILAQSAVKVTSHNIVFFSNSNQALDYLHSS